ncbi:MAG: DEAD/DEAH box helicase family protein [Deltaproteobacteria bacterium]|jgi:type III restriction enzyme|nr:DEAD/DEAH box helicase family protein [Deltaproteobacteria bacterium]
MSIQHVNPICNRLSLRSPQRDSLEILDRICDIVPREKEPDLAAALSTVQSEFPHVRSFDRDFISLCFAIATGVGKTRLMGAFITYLYQAHSIKNFFVIAPNLTIYNKLIADFTPNTSKYVFKGIAEFAQNPPQIVTGDDYESGKGVRESLLGMMYQRDVHINIFNIAKITAKDNKDSKLAKDDARRNVPRIRRLSEYIGESYFSYLSALPDLVVLMDESHRYRADAGMAAINELKPVLGLELTATPQIERGGNKTEDFGNVIYSYPLSAAMTDGFVKEPAVATRENFIASNYTDEGLERIKLEDGVRLHENTKVELEIYARNNDQPIVKPFMLVVAQDTTHANELQRVMEAPNFFEGRYKDRVITVDSKTTKGSESDEIVSKLLTVEDPANPVEIVIHVNMLKEGWDVTNLYTIVPLRAANSRTLVEQSIGRGLRLPYGKRVNVPAVDRLTIVSHDRFQDIVDHANDPNSVIRVGVVIGKDIPLVGQKAVIVPSGFEAAIGISETPPQTAPVTSGTEATGADATGVAKAPKVTPPSTGLTAGITPITKPEEQIIAKVANDVFRQYERLPSSNALTAPEIQKEIVRKVKAALPPVQVQFVGEEVNVAEVVRKTTEIFRALSIDIPRIAVVPVGEVQCYYQEFDLDLSSVNLQPVSDDILVQHLHDQRKRYIYHTGDGIVEEKRPEDYIIRGLIDFDDVDYDRNADTLYRLAGQVVAHLKGYLNEQDMLNVLQFHQKRLVDLVHVQMQAHFVHTASSYEAHVVQGFKPPKAITYSIDEGEQIRDFRTAIPDGMKSKIRTMLFGGFAKCLFPAQKFDTDTERRFAVILENDKHVQKWFKPSRGDFSITYAQNSQYEPDFVVETETCKYLCEPKRADQMQTEEVQAKARAAVTWCARATEHGKTTDGKPWKYLLIPHDKISEQMTLQGFVAMCLVSE